MLHAKSLPGNPYDGHTLRDVIEDTQNLTGCEIEWAYVDKGYRGHAAQNPGRVFISGSSWPDQRSIRLVNGLTL